MRKKVPARGAKPGERRGGRQAGTPNRQTVEKLEQARLHVENARGAGKKLGKEILEDFMHLFAGMAATYQPLPAGVVDERRSPDEDKFLVYAKLAVQTAKDLADFQSPKFKAIMVQGTIDVPSQGTSRTEGDNVVTLNDPIALARVYKRLISGAA